MLSFVRNLVAVATRLERTSLSAFAAIFVIVGILFNSFPAQGVSVSIWEGQRTWYSTVCAVGNPVCSDQAQLAMEAWQQHANCERETKSTCWVNTLGQSDTLDYQGVGPQASDRLNFNLALERAYNLRKAVVAAGVLTTKVKVVDADHNDTREGTRFQGFYISTSEVEVDPVIRQAEERGRVEALDLLNRFARDMSWANKALMMLKVATDSTCVSTTLVFTDDNIVPQMVPQCECPVQSGEYDEKSLMPISFWDQTLELGQWMQGLGTTVAEAMAGYTCQDPAKPVWDPTKTTEHCRAFTQDELLNPQVVVENIRRMRTVILSDPDFQNRLMFMAGTTEGRVQWDGSLSGPTHEFRVYVDDQCPAIERTRADQAAAVAEKEALDEYNRWNHPRFTFYGAADGSFGGTIPGKYARELDPYAASKGVYGFDMAGGFVWGGGLFALQAGPIIGIYADPLASTASGLLKAGGEFGFRVNNSGRYGFGARASLTWGIALLPGEEPSSGGWTQVQDRLTVDLIQVRSNNRNQSVNVGPWASGLFSTGYDVGMDQDQDTLGRNDFAAGLQIRLETVRWDVDWPQPKTSWSW